MLSRLSQLSELRGLVYIVAKGIIGQSLANFSVYECAPHEKTHRACTVSIPESSIQFLIIKL